MNLAIVYDPNCPKLTEDSYSQSYRNMFLSLIDRFDFVQEITTDCSAKDIDANVIIFFDIHSSHHIKIDGIESHAAIKYEYFNDPHQQEFSGTYKGGRVVHKLGAEQRCKRALDRGVQYIICPYTNGYYKYLDPYLPDNMLVWFPVAPKEFEISSAIVRKSEVLCNGHAWQGSNGFRPYQFRKWASAQECVMNVPHSICSDTPSGNDYMNFLSGYAGALALCDTYTVPKYLEIPLAGCVTFAQYNYDYKQMGFKDGESCIYVTKANLHKRINDFKNNIDDYKKIALQGWLIIVENYTAKHFAEYIHNHSKE